MSHKPDNWDRFFALLEQTEVPVDFLSPETRDQGDQEREPFADWVE